MVQSLFLSNRIKSLFEIKRLCMTNTASKYVPKIAIIYMTLPLAIFVLGWTKVWVATLCLVTMGYALYRMLNDHNFCVEFSGLENRDIERLFLSFLVILVWVYFSGIGKFVFQNTDHFWRNGIFEILVNSKWPIVKSLEFDGSQKPYLFVYYIGFWMPSAVVGKLFGLTAGYRFQLVWAAVGIWIFYYLVCIYLRKVSLIPLIVFIFFSGLDVIGTAIFSGKEVSILSTSHLEWYAGMQFSSFTTQLFWVFNQSIPAWILMMMILLLKRNRYIGFLLGVSLICCPLPFIGVIPFVGYTIIRNILNDDGIINSVRELFSIENILGGGISGIVTYLYLKTNVSGQHIALVLNNVSEMKGFVFSVVLFIFLEAGIYFVLIYKYQMKNPLFYITFVFLCTCPFVQIGYGGDYCMRASIPCVVMLYLLVMKTLLITERNKDLCVTISIIVVLVLGAFTPIHEINRTILSTVNRYITGVQVYAKTYTYKEIMAGSNFRGEVGNSVFVQYLLRSS